ncbi:enoyl-CoA hydratase [Rhodococcus rhodochrous J3]|uniref:3-hydroxyisobutyryl-CoA hydrolase n=2 Tax=Rhodococcus rhodochrous TaxID=1829 RepID=A0AA46WXH9_RHORH|nr:MULTISPECIES: enoyl-CoA hydratase/isomerase family protein [Rhodococcus]MBF4479769.1 enoyl-CoA hydratase/isomerase family protein [Rhodococcus rhodochrous]MCD2096616.1 enoyl-CoA hydratase/isomerase family protein [Rhodococcus rhodochrous]MCD2121166.1 enoyl-CoA hydratase/isomerase family protein [Rhodococcus rhodochrous]MCQ4135545.1 enoyl-CoA hydratase/isomerase family protein [Rhodococcus rhodochrous]MDC3726933.1 enoyl-CoA hydratase/isomerase family protein [Rhodococcus sp. Rp3]
MNESFIRTRVANGVGEVQLDRPGALNALDRSMIRDIRSSLLAWRDDPAVTAVLVTSASDRAFCAGGDVKPVRELALEGRFDTVREYFADEYRLDELVATYPKPYLAVLDGVTMGGGLGISVHGAVRVTTEKTTMAMPETAIGFVPDIGSSHFLPRLRGTTARCDAVGMYLGLTGARIDAGDALAVGLATHYVPSARIDDFADRIRAGQWRDALDEFVEPAPESSLAQRFPDIETVFGDGTVLDMATRLDSLADIDAEWAEQTRTALRSLSPTSVWATAELMRRGAESTLEECFAHELDVAVRVAATPDFIEGVRAVLVDKTRDPQWSPATLEDVDPAAIAALFGDG